MKITEHKIRSIFGRYHIVDEEDLLAATCPPAGSRPAANGRNPKRCNQRRAFGAAAELATWRERLANDLQRLGALVLDITPAQTTPDLINSYLRIKADQLL